MKLPIKSEHLTEHTPHSFTVSESHLYIPILDQLVELGLLTNERFIEKTNYGDTIKTSYYYGNNLVATHYYSGDLFIRKPYCENTRQV